MSHDCSDSDNRLLRPLLLLLEQRANSGFWNQLPSSWTFNRQKSRGPDLHVLEQAAAEKDGSMMATDFALQVLRDVAVRRGEAARVDAHLWPGCPAGICSCVRG